mmetsp:Transcript_67153/g.174066  ORF Transcript_67153/g.174066 Transcript_67153/m.174066 type:complete len:285 (+) Transcript_67153:412-1266(+)
MLQTETLGPDQDDRVAMKDAFAGLQACLHLNWKRAPSLVHHVADCQFCHTLHQREALHDGIVQRVAIIKWALPEGLQPPLPCLRVGQFCLWELDLYREVVHSPPQDRTVAQQLELQGPVGDVASQLVWVPYCRRLRRLRRQLGVTRTVISALELQMTRALQPEHATRCGDHIVHTELHGDRADLVCLRRRPCEGHWRNHRVVESPHLEARERARRLATQLDGPEVELRSPQRVVLHSYPEAVRFVGLKARSNQQPRLRPLAPAICDDARCRPIGVGARRCGEHQ